MYNSYIRLHVYLRISIFIVYIHPVLAAFSHSKWAQSHCDHKWALFRHEFRNLSACFVTSKNERHAWYNRGSRPRMAVYRFNRDKHVHAYKHIK